MKQFIIFFTLIFAFPLTGNGGNSSAGGDGVIIKGKSYLLDFVEANIHEKIYFRNPENYSPIVAQAISDNIGIDIETARLISSKLGELHDKNVVLEFLIKWRILRLDWNIVPRNLIHIRDEDTVLEFNNHELVQLAVRQDSTVYINQDQWELLDVVNRTGLIIHEVMYSLRDSFNDNNHYSPPARHLTSLFFDKRSETMTQERFHFILNREGLLFSSFHTNDNILFIMKKGMGSQLKFGSAIFGLHSPNLWQFCYYSFDEQFGDPHVRLIENKAQYSPNSGLRSSFIILNWPDGSNYVEKAKNYFKAVLVGDARTDHRVYQKDDIF